MQLQIDPVVSSVIKQRWAALGPALQQRIAPILAQANQTAVQVSQTLAAPVHNPALVHQALLAKAALTNDHDGVLRGLQPGVVIDVGGSGEIWGTGKYQQLDPGWAESVAAWLDTLLSGPHAFNVNPPNVVAIPDDVTIAIAGDWGTGDWRSNTNPAPSTDVGVHMAFLKPDLTVHLGDVYYAGSKDEEQHLFVNLWPAGSLGSLTLNSNHEMYSGAGPYFDIALADAKFAVQQGRGFFALENANWVVVGLDSAYYSKPEEMYQNGRLQAPGGPSVQIDFLRAQVAKGKKTIVMTHHNGLSEDGVTPQPIWNEVMGAFPANSGPAIWYWGHIHAGAIYKPFGPANVRTRCCGHGALPWGQAPVMANSPQVAWHETRSANDPDIPQRVLNGFAVLHLSGPDIQEVFYDENGGVAQVAT